MAARRRTKIVATLGPSSTDDQMLDAMIDAGTDLVRLNFSHGDPESFVALAQRVRQRAEARGRDVGVLADLQGPKIRIARFREGKINLSEGDFFALDTNHDSESGDQHCVGVDFKTLHQDVASGDTLLLDDGRIVLTVTAVHGTRVDCRVDVGGVLSSNKGINRLGGGLSADALTDKDKADIHIAARLQADYVAVSFPRNAADIDYARQLLRDAGSQAALVAKIERTEAVDALEEIILASDAIMVARGDLGVEVGDAALPPIQKEAIAKARRMNRLTIIATQMMESMIENAIPTRAEVFDVANAVLDGTDAVMLSGETAVGRHPDKVIAAVDRICLQAEQQRSIRVSSHRIDSQFERMDEAIAMGAMYVANHLGVRAIAAITESGSTTLWMSRMSSGIPIIAMTPHQNTRRRVTLYRGVYPLLFRPMHTDYPSVEKDVVSELQRRGVVEDGDIVIITRGDLEKQGSTNAMKLVRVGETTASEISHPLI